MAKKFVVSDDSVLNDRGFRVLTSGIRTDNFKKNPIGLYMHKRSDRWDLTKESILPICQWPELTIEGTTLQSEPMFDQDDDFAKKIEKKVENGFLRMASIGIVPITTSSSEEYLLPGQTRETVVECDLVEISVVDFGSNPNAIALYKYDDHGDLVSLSSDKCEDFIPLISSKNQETTKPVNNMKKIAIQLGMKEDSTEEELVEAVKKVQQTNTTLSTEVETIRLNSITSEVDQAVAAKKFAADKRDHFINLGKTAGIETLKSTIELMNPAIKPLDIIKPGKTGDQSDDKITLSSIAEIGGISAVEALKAENPEEYKRLYKAEYGVSC